MMDHEADRRLGQRIVRLKRHWPRILAGAGLCGLVSLAVSLFLPRIYRATTDILVSESKIGPGVELPAWQYATLPTYEPFVDNDAAIQRAIERFHLDWDPYNMSVEAFRRRDILSVRALKSTRLLEINVEFPDARLAADLANFFAQGAVEFNEKLNVADATASRSFQAHLLEDAEVQLAAADRRRTEIRARARIEDREKELNILLREKEQLSTQTETLQMDLVQDESKAKYLQQALSREPDTLRLTKSIATDRLAEKALEKLEDKGNVVGSISEETLNTTKEKVRHDFVEAMADAEGEKAGAQEAAARLEKVNRIIGVLLANLAVIRGDVDKADHDYDLARDAVEIANRNYQNAAVNANSKTQDIEQLAPAVVPQKPARPRLFLNTLLGGLLGLIALSGFAALREDLHELGETHWDALEEDRPVRISP